MMNELEQLVTHIKHYLGPQFGTPDEEHRMSFLTHAINHLGGIAQDYAKLGVENERLREELSASQQTNREWLAANGPGGWIDDLRLSRTSPPAPSGEAPPVCTNCGESARPHATYADFVGPFCEGCWDRLREFFTAPSGWQPIESAPKDGTHVVLLVTGCRTIAVIGHWFDFGQVVHGVIGFWEAGATQVAPTHWMPLPSGPGQHAKDALPPSSSPTDPVTVSYSCGCQYTGHTPAASCPQHSQGVEVPYLDAALAQAHAGYEFAIAEVKRLRRGIRDFIAARGKHDGEHGNYHQVCGHCEEAYVRAESTLDAMVDALPPSGWQAAENVLYCYGGCGRRYGDFGLDVILPTPLWNQIAVGAPFDETQEGIEREGRGGVLCAQCIVNRLAKLPDVTVAFIGVDRPDALPPSSSPEFKVEEELVEADASPAKDPIANAVHADLAPLASELIDIGHKLAKSHAFGSCVHCGWWSTLTICRCGRERDSGILPLDSPLRTSAGEPRG